MKVHQVVHHSAFEVVLDPVDDDPSSDVDDLDVGEVRLVLRVERLIHLFVVPDAIAKVLGRFLRVLPLVVWRRGLDLEDVGHDEGLIIALGLDEQGLDVGGVEALLDPSPPGLDGVRCIQNGDDSLASVEPFDHVLHRCLGGGVPQPFALRVALVEEVCRGLRGIQSPVRSHIEVLGRNGEPPQITNDCSFGQQSGCLSGLCSRTLLSYQALSAGWQSDHDDA